MFWLIIIYIIHIYFFIEFLDYYYDLVLLFLFYACYPIVHIVSMLFAFFLKQKRESKLLLTLGLVIMMTFYLVGIFLDLVGVSLNIITKMQPMLSSVVSIIYLSAIFIYRAVQYYRNRKEQSLESNL